MAEIFYLDIAKLKAFVEQRVRKIIVRPVHNHIIFQHILGTDAGIAAAEFNHPVISSDLLVRIAAAAGKS